MREMPLSQDKVALVDDVLVSSPYAWTASLHRRKRRKSEFAYLNFERVSS